MSEPIRRPPGPQHHYYLRSPLLSAPGPLVNLPRMVEQYGPTAFWRFLHISSYLFANPADIEAVLVTHHRSFQKGIGTRANPEVFGSGLLTSEGDFWLRQRRLSQPAFHRARISGYAEIMAQHAQHMLKVWRNGQQLDIHAEMMKVTLAIATRTLFGVDIAPQMDIIAHSLEAFIRQNSGLNIWQLILKLPTPRRYRYHRGVRELNDIVYGIIRQRRNSLLGDDLLSDLLRAQDSDGSSMNDQQIRDEVMTMLLAGHETTALALSWAWYLLAKNPEAEARLQDELDRVLSGRLPTAQDVSQLPYASNVVRETMRLYPPAWIVTRNAAADVTIGDYLVPAGSNVIVSQWLTHRDPRFFTDPERFDPERWSPEREGNLPRFAYFPFGGGPRMCIGAGFAMMEAVVLLAAFAQCFRAVLLPDHQVEPLPSITLRPRHGVWVQLQQRERV